MSERPSSDGTKRDTNKIDLYKESGVDIHKADELVDWIKTDSTETQTPHGSQVTGVGGFAALFRPDFSGLEKPLLVTGTDGVGTKVLLASQTGMLEGLGQDLVAMCVNDLYTLGAKPLFFLDYYATGAIDDTQFKQIITGIKQALKRCKAVLIGGETAEMPGLYAKGHFDLAGFVVGCVDEEKLLGPKNVCDGDVLYALTSSGLHSNGFSLVRHWLKNGSQPEGIAKKLLAPTRLYTEIPELVERLGVSKIHAAANITGGGISGNLPRVMPENALCRIELNSLPVQPWVKEFIEHNGATIMDVEPTFNLGCGMIVSIAKTASSEFESLCRELELETCRVGEVSLNESTDDNFKEGAGEQSAQVVFY